MVIAIVEAGNFHLVNPFWRTLEGHCARGLKLEKPLGYKSRNKEKKTLNEFSLPLKSQIQLIYHRQHCDVSLLGRK